ncbi:MAG: substrate-binding domain-containing protein [Clostridium sp.]
MTLAVIPTLLGDFLPNALDLYHEKCPQVSFNIFNEKSIPVARRSLPGLYDIGLCSMVENKDDLVLFPSPYQELVVIVRNDHPLAVHDSIELTALKGYMLFHLPRYHSHWQNHPQNSERKRYGSCLLLR